jgi:glycosyltransferase involved in cell wall biosynthesis
MSADDRNSPETGAKDNRPVLAIVANALPPYRLHVHQRISREIPEMRLATVLTHEVSNAPWALSDVEGIGLINFGHGEQSSKQAALSRIGHEWRKGGRIVRWMKEQSVKAVLINGYNDPGRLRIIRWCHRNRIPSMMFGDSNILGDNPSGWRGAVKRAVLPPILRQVNAILPCGRLGREYYERYGVPSEDIFYSPYEPNYRQIQIIRQEVIEAAASRFGIKAGRRRIVFSGRLLSVKRPELLVDAFKRIASERPDWDLLMIGDGAMRSQLVARLGVELARRVTWTGFLDDQETVSALYRNCDVLALPSDYEPWALVINEAAAAGLAIVCSEVVGAAAELVVPGRNGEKFPAGSLDGLVDALLRVTDPARIDSYRSESPAVLNEWRAVADPVDGLRRALQHIGAHGDSGK